MASIVILGSFRRHYAGIAATVHEFEALGVRVLSPKPGRPLDPGAEFVVLDTDETEDPRAIADQVLACVDQADAVYFYNPDGYLGPSASFELGYCVARSKRTFCAEPPQDPLLVLYAGRAAAPAEIAAELNR